MTIRPFLAGAAVLALAGCAAPIAMFTAQDAQTAAAVAAAAGLASDAQCWQAYAGIANAIGGPASGPSPQAGLLTVIETKRAIQATMGAPSCAPITAQIVGEVLKLSSPQGAGLATILGF